LGALPTPILLIVVATLVAGVVVIVRQPESVATTQAEPLQVGAEAPSLTRKRSLV
jgi:hypothetical protein